MDLTAELARYGPDAPPPAMTLNEARDYCRRLAQSHYENFSVISLLLPRHLRQHFANVYAYCRWADDLADEIPLPLGEGGLRSKEQEGVRYKSLDKSSALTPALSQRERESLRLLDWWQQQLDALFDRRQATHPVFVALAETIGQFELPRQPLADLLVAFRRDQVQARYETLNDLLTYCAKSANPVGRIVLHLGGSFDEENARLADSICTGLQLANFWQDVRRDFERGRIYLPQELCRLHGWDEARFAACRVDDAFRDLLRPLVDRGGAFLLAGRPLVERVHRDLRGPVRLFLAGGEAVLAAIRSSGYDVWSRRPTVGRLTKLVLIASAWWRG